MSYASLSIWRQQDCPKEAFQALALSATQTKIPREVLLGAIQTTGRGKHALDFSVGMRHDAFDGMAFESAATVQVGDFFGPNKGFHLQTSGITEALCHDLLSEGISVMHLITLFPKNEVEGFNQLVAAAASDTCAHIHLSASDWLTQCYAYGLVDVVYHIHAQ